MAEDITGGLKNALERGGSLELAIRSFINAGYNEKEVREAAAQLSAGTLSSTSQPQATAIKPQVVPQIPRQTIPVQRPIPLPIQTPQRLNPQPQVITSQPHKSFGAGLVMILAIILVLLIAVLLGTIFFKEEIVSFIQNLF